ncbi:hypothetical protein [Kineosporia sp. NBRC 101731]|uniref:TIGR03943 family putative permease subunit n=1 Tax=Kineosporia sp. NBRC 101731 TaxID=3032199 RepID=UPI0024A43A85|nr:hypothetical protein [Kineosporia sp. NBRC 101731]GLY32378.1 hypothetical protein Kisp02_57430 [Kineosporia sp. NBRC 101731]
MTMRCCAADAAAIRVLITGQDAPSIGQWVTVEGTLAPYDSLVQIGSHPPRLQATRATPAAVPRNPYE